MIGETGRYIPAAAAAPQACRAHILSCKSCVDNNYYSIGTRFEINMLLLLAEINFNRSWCRSSVRYPSRSFRIYIILYTCNNMTYIIVLHTINNG